MPQFEFFTAEQVDKSMRQRISRYITKLSTIHYSKLLEKDRRDGTLVCPICNSCFPDYTFFRRHFRYRKRTWELRLLERIRKYGPRKLNVFDIFYRKNGEDLELKDRIRFWVLCVKIHEDLNPMPWWYDKWFKYTPEDYMAKLFWHYDKQAKKEIE